MDYSEKIYTKKSILFATFFGGPLVAGFLIYKNFKVFGKNPAARRSLIISIAFTIILFYSLFLIPASVFDKIPNFVIPFIYTGVIALIIGKYQDTSINEFLNSGGQKASNWFAFGYSLAGLVLILLFVFALATAKPPFEGYDKSKIYNKTILYSSKELDRTVPEKIINAIKQSGLLDVNQESDLFLSEGYGKYILKFVLTDFKIISDSIFLLDYNLFENVINSKSNLDKKIEVKFTDPFLSQVIDLPSVKTEEDKSNKTTTPPPYGGFSNLHEFRINFFQSIHYNSEMPLIDIKIVAQSITKLQGYFPPNNKLDLIFLNNGEYYTTKFFIRPEIWDNYPSEDRLRSTIEYFRKAGIKKEIEIIIINSQTYKEKKI